MNYVIVGNGRVAHHISHYFSLLDLSFVRWSRTDSIPFNEAVNQSSHVLVLISDRAVEPFLHVHANLLKNCCCVHFSGSLVTSRAWSAHPLMTFGSRLYGLTDYESIPWVIEKEGPDFSTLLPGLKNVSYPISQKEKPLYHAWCVMANNFTTLLWQQFATTLSESLGISAQAAIPILKRTFFNLIQNSEAALTGPLVRNDFETIEKNMIALQGDAYQAVYRAFVKSYCEEGEGNEYS